MVDDEEQVRNILRSALVAAGYFVSEAANYSEAIDVLDAASESFDLLISDVSLPGSNGCELALRFLERQPAARVLFISGYTGAEVARHYVLRFSDREFLAKPFQPEELVARVGEILESEMPEGWPFRSDRGSQPARPSDG